MRVRVEKAAYAALAFREQLEGRGQMAFKKAPPPTDVAASPDKLFLALPRRKIPDVLPHQREVLRRYSSEALTTNVYVARSWGHSFVYDRHRWL